MTTKVKYRRSLYLLTIPSLLLTSLDKSYGMEIKKTDIFLNPPPHNQQNQHVSSGGVELISPQDPKYFNFRRHLDILPLDEREEFSQKILPYVQNPLIKDYGSKELEDFKHFIEVTQGISREERVNALEAFLQCFNEPPFNVHTWATFVRYFSKEDKEDCAKLFQHLVTEDHAKEYHRFTLFFDLCVYKSQLERREIFSKIAPILLTLNKITFEEFASLLRSLDNFPLQKRQEVLNFSMSMAQQLFGLEDQKYILSIILRFPPEDIIERLERLEVFIKNRQDPCLLPFYITLSKLPIDELKEIEARFLPCIQHITEQEAYYYLFFNYLKRTTEEREYFSKLLSTTFNHLVWTDNIETFLILEIDRIPHSELDEILKLAEPIIKSSTVPVECARLISTLSKIAPEKRQALLEGTVSLIGHTLPDLDNFIFFLKKMEDIPEEDFEFFVKQLEPVLSGVNSIGGCFCILDLVQTIPVSFRPQVCDAIQHLKEINLQELLLSFEDDSYTFLPMLLSHNDTLKQGIFNAWREALSSSDEKVVERIGEYITEWAEELRLEGTNPLLQEAIRALTLLETSDDPLNPFNIFRHLKEKRLENVNLTTLFLAREIMDSQNIVMNPLYLYELGHKTLAEDIPIHQVPKFNPKLLEDMTEQLEKKITSAPQIDDKIKNHFGCNWHEIKAGALGSFLLKNLLQVDHDEKISLLSAKFRAIAAWITSLDNTCVEEGDLTAQEEGFLRTLINIQTCRTGKEEGIKLFYSYLDNNFKISLGGELTPLETLVNHTIIQEVEKMMSGTNQYIKAIIGMNPQEEVQEAVHQAKYVKNVIGPDIGLNELLSFDNHTQMLYEDLVNCPKQRMMEEFYRHFQPSNLINQMARKITESINNKASGVTYMDVINFIPIDQKEEAFEINTDSGQVILTPLGAIMVLKHMGVLQN